MSEKIEHKIIYPEQCPRCGGTHTTEVVSEDALSRAFICKDCEAKSPDSVDAGYYEVLYTKIIESVNWTVDGGSEWGEEHEVSDSRYLKYTEAGNAFACLEEFVGDLEAVGIETAREEWPDLVTTYEKAKAIIVRAKGESV